MDLFLKLSVLVYLLFLFTHEKVRERRSQNAEETYSRNHEKNSHEPSAGAHRIKISVAHGRHGNHTPPNGFPGSFNVRILNCFKDQNKNRGHHDTKEGKTSGDENRILAEIAEESSREYFSRFIDAIKTEEPEDPGEAPQSQKPYIWNARNEIEPAGREEVFYFVIALDETFYKVDEEERAQKVIAESDEDIDLRRKLKEDINSKKTDGRDGYDSDDECVCMVSQ